MVVERSPFPLSPKIWDYPEDLGTEGRQEWSDLLGLSGSPDLALRNYRNSLSRWPLPDSDETARLAKRREAGRRADARLKSDPEVSPLRRSRLLLLGHAGRAARESLINPNLRLVLWRAKRYVGSAKAQGYFTTT